MAEGSEKSLKEIGVAPPKGFRDFLPRQTVIRDQTLSSIITTYRSYGFERIETPAIEDVRRLQHSEGGENLGLLFKILKRGEKLDLTAPGLSEESLVDLALRYDLTVPLARYFAEHRNELPSVFKSVHVGPVWRAERPQKGRYRQFMQCDIDIIGGAAPAAEIELITVTIEALSKFPIKDTMVNINDRRILSAMVECATIPEERRGHALVTLDKLDKLGIDGVKELFLKEGYAAESVQQLLDFATLISQTVPGKRLDAVRASKFGALLPPQICSDLQVIVDTVNSNRPGSIEFNPFLVRGMGYYTGPVFEVTTPHFKGSIAGGGRYDKLIGKLSGIDAPACGFSIGFERIVDLLENVEQEPGAAKKIALFYDSKIDAFSQVLTTLQVLRSAGHSVSMLETPKNMKTTLEKLKALDFTDFARFKAGEAPALKTIER